MRNFRGTPAEGYLPSNARPIPVDIEQYQMGAGDIANERLSFNSLNKRDPRYQLHLMEIMAQNLEILGSMRIINRGITTRKVTLSTVPSLIIRSSSAQAITITNPTQAVGLTSSFTLYPAGTIFNADGNSQATNIGVANYDSLHLFVNVTAVGGAPAMDMWAQTKDPLTGNWVDVQYIAPVGGFTATGTYYSFFSGFGVLSQFALRWASAAWGSITGSVSYTLKNGLGGSSSGSAQTVFIGSGGVSQFSGYPILEGQYRDFNMRENVELWGVTGGGTVDINIIEFT